MLHATVISKFGETPNIHTRSIPPQHFENRILNFWITVQDQKLICERDFAVWSQPTTILVLST